MEGDHATIRLHFGTRSLRGVLASKKGKGMSFAQIREATAKAAGRLFDACDRGDVVIVALPAVLAECLCWSLFMAIHVERSHRRSADSSPALVLKSVTRRFTWMHWIAIERRRSISSTVWSLRLLLPKPCA